MAYSSELYQQVILDHNKNPRNFSVLEDATHSCQGHNPLCGDNITIYLRMAPDNTVEAATFQGSGCTISKASSSLLTAFVVGKKTEDLQTAFDEFHQMVKGESRENAESSLGKLKLFEGVKEYPARVKCATLSWHALMGALKNSSEASTEKIPEPVQNELAEIPILDLTEVKCPINFVKTKVRLSKMEVGEALKVILDDGDPVKNVSRSLEMEGQKIIEHTTLPGGQHQLVVRKSN